MNNFNHNNEQFQAHFNSQNSGNVPDEMLDQISGGFPSALAEMLSQIWNEIFK